MNAPVAPRFLAARFLVNVALVTAFVFGVTSLGFYPSLVLYLTAHMLYLGVRPVVLVVLVALGVGAAFWLGFEYLLRVPVPTGWFWG
jgi:hypothetical protein